MLQPSAPSSVSTPRMAAHRGTKARGHGDTKIRNHVESKADVLDRIGNLDRRLTIFKMIASAIKYCEPQTQSSQSPCVLCNLFGRESPYFVAVSLTELMTVRIDGCRQCGRNWTTFYKKWSDARGVGPVLWWSEQGICGDGGGEQGCWPEEKKETGLPIGQD